MVGLQLPVPWNTDSFHVQDFFLVSKQPWEVDVTTLSTGKNPKLSPDDVSDKWVPGCGTPDTGLLLIAKYSPQTLCHMHTEWSQW